MEKIEDRCTLSATLTSEPQSAYLQAIQAIPGSVPGEKYRWLNTIAKRVAAVTKAQGDSAAAAAPQEVPEPLLPLVRLETANILRQHCGVVEALKSPDNIVVERALSLRWFFRGDNKDIVSVEYFQKNILPHVSLNTRVQLVKRLAINLRTAGEKKLAQDFYDFFARKYGRRQAEPLLVACGENFVYDTVKAKKIILSCHVVRILFVDYPELIVRYMKLSKAPSEEGFDDSHNIGLDQYSDFLPRLIKNHSGAFVELLERHKRTFGMKLSNKATETFLKSNVEALLRKPKLYTKIMPLKVIAAKLTKSQYKCMFGKLFPERWQEFGYREIREYLKFYPEQERITLVMDLYREIYDKNFLDNTDAIDENFLCMLPADERVKQARVKLEKEPDSRRSRYDVARIWRCYLPIEESIASIKSEIAKTSTSDGRAALLNQMFYTCKVNDDKDALLVALKYFTTRHKNEQTQVIFEVLDELAKHFDLSTLGKDHWVAIDDFIRFLHVKDELTWRSDIPKKILVAGLHFELIHDLPIDDKIAMIVEINMRGWNKSWSTLEKHPEYDRRCFEAYMTMIPKRYPKDHEIWENRRLNIVQSIVKTMYEFNTRNAKANCKIEKLSIKNYPWLLEDVADFVQSKKKQTEGYSKINSIIEILKIHEKDLYNAWIVEDEIAVVEVEIGEAKARLAKNPKNILENWEEYLKRARITVSCSRCTQSFVRATRWHQDIPIRFADSCFKVDEASSVIMLGILMQGEEFARVVEPLMPRDSTIDTKTDAAKSTYGIISSIPTGMNLANPPVPLSLVLPFCDGDYLQLGLASLTNICRRTSVAQIEPFAKSLVDRRVSVRKHGIRLFCLVASIDELREFLANLWNTEKHRSIRAVIFGKIHGIFISEPNRETWTIMKNCMADLKLDDDDSLQILMNFNGIPDEYVAEYVKQLLETIEKLGANGLSEKLTAEHLSTVIQRLVGRLSKRMPEEFSEMLLRKYFCNPSQHADVSSAAKSFAMYGYLSYAGDKLESRLTVICGLFEDRLRKHWNVPHPKVSSFFPVNYMAHDFMNRLMFLKKNDSQARGKIMEAVLRSFLAVLKPECDIVSYAMLTYGIALKDAKTPTEMVTRIVDTLPRLVAAVSPEVVAFLPEIVKGCLSILVDDDQLEDVMIDLTESLCKIGTDYACLLAAKFLFVVKSEKFDERRVKIVEFLRETKYPAVVSLVYLYMNTRQFPE